jgi:hypothetical protein
VATPQRISVYVCDKCGWADFHATKNCPHCHAKTKNSILPGIGKIATYTTIRYPPKGFEEKAPYSVALVDIENGPRVIGRLSATGEGLRIGAAVVLKSNENGVLEFQLIH